MQISFRLDKEEHKEIVEFLEDAPKKWIITEALKMYISNYKNMTSAKEVVATEEENLKASSFDF